ncbi:HTH domain-containing protein [Leptolyngbya sp. FACHB-261]|uniref:HTH domain-containing protein n=1 Tax=Leptolyngbya sp. FACHB-261 TaxID=2692806 RepID=UPI0037BF8BA8
MRKADRLFQLVNLIKSHQPITAEQLAERIGVSVRTIYRIDITTWLERTLRVFSSII